jgi:Mg/Co/Ni transporter MgtE
MSIVLRADVMAPATITHLQNRRRRETRLSSDVANSRVGEVTRTSFVRIPSWFTAAQALRVAHLKAVAHLLIEERGRLVGSIGVAALTSAPATDPVARWMDRSAAHLTPDLSCAEAERVLRREGVTCLPVVTGGLLVGTASLEELEGDVARAA